LEVKTPGISGRISQEAFQFFNQESASLKTSRATLPVGCITYCATWEDWVTEQRGAYSARLNAAHRTNASGCSSWPTAATRDYKGESGSGRQERKGHPADTLPNAMAQWPSPVASEVRQGFQDRSRGMKGSQESLTTVVIKSWPTPAARDHKDTGENVDMEKVAAKCKLAGVVAVHGHPVPASSSMPGSLPESLQTATVSTGANRQKDGSMTDKLDQQVKNWATARSGMARGSKFTYDRGKGNIEEQAGASVRGGGKLNPRWVETLMGLPVGWTMPSCASPVTIERMNSDSSVTVLSQQQQNELSGS